MLDLLEGLGPLSQALIGGGFAWLLTALGAACVFATRTVNQKLLDAMLGFAAGVMIAASFWSLLLPAIKMSENHKIAPWVPAAAGFLLGTVFLRLIDRVLPHLHLGFPMSEAEGMSVSWRRSTLLVTAVTLHNIPEGLAIGVAFGAAAAELDSASLAAAIALAVGIGIQDFPEGLAISLPLRREGLSRAKSFWYGQLSGAVEIVAAVIGAGLVTWVQSILPYGLSFAAGAMIFVVVEQVIPESQRGGNTDLATGGTILGFVVMMILDVALG